MPAATRPLEAWQGLACGMLFVITLVSVHGLVSHLQPVLVPFLLSAFLVFAVEPFVEAVDKFLAGRAPPYRWFGCTCSRRKSDPETTEPDYRVHMMTHALEGLIRFLAVTLIMVCMLLIACLAGILVLRGATHMKDNWDAYKIGFARLTQHFDDIVDSASKILNVSGPLDQRLKTAYATLLKGFEEGMWTLANSVLSGITDSLATLLITFLYMLFWLLTPLPVLGKANALVRSYISKKAVCSLLYGLCVAVWFVILEIDLAMLFGVVSFFLNFIPEVGSVISMIVPMPIILLDGRNQSPILLLVVATFGQMVLKLLFGNILEVKLVENDREMKIHPVWVILGLTYFGFIWGPIGTLISVPLLAMLKTAALSMQTSPSSDSVISPTILGVFVACLEGRPGKGLPTDTGVGSESVSTPRTQQDDSGNFGY